MLAAAVQVALVLAVVQVSLVTAAVQVSLVTAAVQVSLVLAVVQAALVTAAVQVSLKQLAPFGSSLHHHPVAPFRLAVAQCCIGCPVALLALLVGCL